MIKKSFSKSGKSCRVTFKVTAEGLEQAELDNVEEIAVLGDFNEWDPSVHPMKKRKNGSYSTTVSLEAGRPYDFRYLVDGKYWINDDEADKTAVSAVGTQNAVLEL